MADESSNIVDNWEEINEDEMFDQSKAVSETKQVAKLKEPIIIQGEDSFRTQYLPPEPSVKILKRPSQAERLNESCSDFCLNGHSKPVKTYEQREAEYLEARERIMGHRNSLEDTTDDRVVQFDISPAKYTLLRPTGDNSKSNPEVLRSPKGPDGSHGFTLKR